jgi:hypothetical protein
LMGLDSHIDITDEDIDMIMRNRKIHGRMCRKTKNIDPMSVEMPVEMPWKCPWKGSEGSIQRLSMKVSASKISRST